MPTTTYHCSILECNGYDKVAKEFHCCYHGPDCEDICKDCGNYIDDHDLRAYACDVQS
jgi:hypothetical protein